MKKHHSKKAAITQEATDSVATALEDTKLCPYCAESIKMDAKKCKHCKEVLDDELRTEQQQISVFVQPPKWSPGVAAVLSLFIPGAGQIYKGQIGNGLVWLILVAIGYLLLVVPGLILHIFCIIGAASGDPNKQ